MKLLVTGSNPLLFVRLRAVLFATAAAASGQTFTTLHSFDITDGSGPPAALLQATNGDFYGTTSNINGGTAFKISASGTFTLLHTFCSQSSCSDGSGPQAPLVQAADGYLYGTTCCGGVNGAGTVFRMSLGGKVTTIYTFCAEGDCSDDTPTPAALVKATDGNLYGTTRAGGSNNGGTVFKVTPGGTLTTLYNFCSEKGCSDGIAPNGLIQARNGMLYGTAFEGGAYGVGEVFEITTGGTLAVLYSFFCKGGFCPYGANPDSELVQSARGSLYGTTSSGGANGSGSVFEIGPNGGLKTLVSFCTPMANGSCPDGYDSEGPLVQATDGNLYGTASGGGAKGGGTIFRISPSGTFTTLYSFCSQVGCADGSAPSASLVQGTYGILYGTTAFGGLSNSFCPLGCGTIFSLSVGLGPFVQTQTTVGKVGSNVEILGNDLTDTTGVTFNGTAAAFKVASSSLVTATVPVGATSGEVQVISPSSTLTSNLPFRVVQ
jgi:uncharacterized repeat protein (TIGR03803 family)